MTSSLKAAWVRTLPSIRLTFDFLAVLAAALAMLWLAVVMPITALAQETSSGATNAPQIIHASTIDIDRDGTYDRAVLVRNPRTGDADLYIYLQAGGLTPMPVQDFTREPPPGETTALEATDKAANLAAANDPNAVLRGAGRTS